MLYIHHLISPSDVGGGIILAYRIGIGGLENRSHLPKVTELGSGGVWVRIWVCQPKQKSNICFYWSGSTPLELELTERTHLWGSS